MVSASYRLSISASIHFFEIISPTFSACSGCIVTNRPVELSRHSIQYSANWFPRQRVAIYCDSENVPFVLFFHDTHPGPTLSLNSTVTGRYGLSK